MKVFAAFCVLALLLCPLISCTPLVDWEKQTDSEQPTGSRTLPDSENTTGKRDVSESGSATDADEGETSESPAAPQPTFIPLNSTTAGIRMLGERYLASDRKINCDWTCSGFEFRINNQGNAIRFFGSSTAPCYFRAYIDGEEWLPSGSNPYYTLSATSGSIALRNVPIGVHTVRLIKVTGYTLARAEISSMTLTGELLTDEPAQNDWYIEFVGDSISCGWGTIGNRKGAYTDQDGTFAYPYLLAQDLQADYAITALSGQGLLCGTPGVTNGYLYASPMRNASDPYTFERKADLVVVNIGTNDFNNSQVTAEAFRDAYRAFLTTVREKNGPDCKILCLYNTMNNTYSAEILSVVQELGGVPSGIWVVSLARAAGNQHPTISEHQAYRKALLPLIEQILRYRISTQP